MAIRIISSIIGLPILIFIVYKGGSLLQFASLSLVLIGMKEFYSVVSDKKLPVHYIAYLFAILYFLSLNLFSEKVGLIILSMIITLSFLMMVIFFSKVNIIDCALSLTGFLYICVLMSFIYIIRESEKGDIFVWLIFISAWGSDTFAYFTGVAIGKHKLCPSLSPKKTIEGAIGGVVGATVLAFIYSIFIEKIYPGAGKELTFVFCIISALGAVFSQLGDLSASSIKRYTNTKDFGKLIPGHGGVLDRFDSILFTAPAVYMVYYIFSSLR